MSKSVKDTYINVVENYDYFNMYPPIDVTHIQITNKSNSKDIYNRYIEDYDYASEYVPPSIKNSSANKDNIDDIDEIYGSRIENYDYADEDAVQDPDELLRTAEDHIEILQNVIRKMSDQMTYLLGENQDNRQLLERLKITDDRSELINDLQLKSKKLNELELELKDKNEINDYLILENKKVSDENKAIKSGNVILKNKLDDLKMKKEEIEKAEGKIEDREKMYEKKHRYDDEREGHGDLFSMHNFQNHQFDFDVHRTPSKKKVTVGRKRRH